MGNLTTSLIVIAVLIAIMAYLRLRARRSEKTHPTLRRRVRAKRLQLIDRQLRREAAAKAAAEVEANPAARKDGRQDPEPGPGEEPKDGDAT